VGGPNAQPGRGSVERYPLLSSILFIAGHSRLLARGAELARAAVTEFFLPQFETRLFPGLRPVVTLAHPLDERLPLRTNRLRFYLGYMGLVLKTLGFIRHSCGSRAQSEVARMLGDLCRLYYLSGSIYRRCQSTTLRRLPPRADPYSLLIRLFDPHLHCVPSLHILAMCYNYWAAAQGLRRHLPPDHPALARLPELFDLAVRMTETVLLVRQHSVMDIAPSLFLLSRAFPGYRDAEVRRFVGALFTQYPATPRTLRALRALRAEVLRGYRELKQSEKLAPARDAAALVVEYLFRHALPAPAHDGRPG